MSNAEEKSSKASTDMLPLSIERNISLTIVRRAASMLIEKNCKDCES